VFGNSASHGSSKAVFPTLSYDPAADFQPISLIYQNLLVVAVGKDFPANSIPELVRHAKANPGKLSYGTPGLGTPHQLAGETLKSRAGIDMLHVPFKGGGMVMNALLGGSIDIAMSALAAAREMQKAGRIKILGVLAEHRIDTLPEVPAVAESYPGINISGWSGLFGPKNLPRDMVVRLNAAMRQILDSQDVKAVLAPVGLVVSPSTPEALGKLVREENERWQQIVRSGVKVTE